MMRVLLDTHVFLWVVTDSRKLRAPARATISAASEIFISAASIWEIAIKARLGKLTGDASELASAITASGFRELPVTARHAARVGSLPLLHADPFDRILIAQALEEPLRLLTADQALEAYGAPVELIQGR